MVIQTEKIDQKTIEQIDAQIKNCIKGANKIENGNYILAMLLKDIKDGKVKNLLDVTKWCFEKIKIGKEVNYMLTKLEKDDMIDLSKEKEKINE